MIDIIKNYWLEFVLTAVSSGLVMAVKKIYSEYKKESEEQVSIKIGMVALLHDSLFRNCEAYISKGEISVNELDNLESLYSSYHALGGNGTGTALYERCKNLDLKS